VNSNSNIIGSKCDFESVVLKYHRLPERNLEIDKEVSFFVKERHLTPSNKRQQNFVICVWFEEMIVVVVVVVVVLIPIYLTIAVDNSRKVKTTCWII
jgi:hypothetical protein